MLPATVRAELERGEDIAASWPMQLSSVGQSVGLELGSPRKARTEYEMWILAGMLTSQDQSIAGMVAFLPTGAGKVVFPGWVELLIGRAGVCGLYNWLIVEVSVSLLGLPTSSG